MNVFQSEEVQVQRKERNKTRESTSKSKIKKESVTERVCALTLILSDSRLTCSL